MKNINIMYLQILLGTAIPQIVRVPKNCNGDRRARPELWPWGKKSWRPSLCCSHLFEVRELSTALGAKTRSPMAAAAQRTRRRRSSRLPKMNIVPWENGSAIAATATDAGMAVAPHLPPRLPPRLPSLAMVKVMQFLVSPVTLPDADSTTLFNSSEKPQRFATKFWQESWVVDQSLLSEFCGKSPRLFRFLHGLFAQQLPCRSGWLHETSWRKTWRLKRRLEALAYSALLRPNIFVCFPRTFLSLSLPWPSGPVFTDVRFFSSHQWASGTRCRWDLGSWSSSILSAREVQWWRSMRFDSGMSCCLADFVAYVMATADVSQLAWAYDVAIIPEMRWWAGRRHWP